jgi:hypothetical protein
MRVCADICISRLSNNIKEDHSFAHLHIHASAHQNLIFTRIPIAFVGTFSYYRHTGNFKQVIQF